VTWFLVGGDLYTAYTFMPFPRLAFGAGAIAFFAVPYTIMIYPILFLVFRVSGTSCHKRTTTDNTTTSHRPILCVAGSVTAGSRLR